MEFKKLEKKVVERMESYGKKYDIKIDEEFALVKLFEELGEFSQALLIHKKKSRPEKYLSEKDSKREVAKELADVICLAIVNANLLGIDLEEAIDKKWISREWYKENIKK